MLHGLGVTIFCFVPLAGLTLETLVLGDWNAEKAFGNVIQWIVGLTAFWFIAREKRRGPDEDKAETMRIRRWTFFFEVSTLFIAIFHYTGHEVAELGQLLGVEGYMRFTFTMLIESVVLLVGLVILYTATNRGVGAFQAWQGKPAQPTTCSVHAALGGKPEETFSPLLPGTGRGATPKKGGRATTPRKK